MTLRGEVKVRPLEVVLRTLKKNLSNDNFTIVKVDKKIQEILKYKMNLGKEFYKKMGVVDLYQVYQRVGDYR